MKKTFPSVFIVAALSLTLATTAAASLVIDSSSALAAITAPIATYKRGIVFTTGSAGPYTINDIKLKFSVSVLGSYTFIAGIYDVVSNLPSSLRASATLPIIATSTGFQLYDFNSAVLNSLGTYSLGSGVQYALIFTGSSSPNALLVRNSLTIASYTVSDGFTVDNSVFSSGVLWQSVPAQSYVLQLDVGGPTPAVPEPSTYALFSLGIGGLALLKRRQGRA